MAPPAEDALLGQTLASKYRVLRQIGRGGMGVVYEAEHIELGKRVAIKLMLEKYTDDGEASVRFKREALAASRIGNPHIIDISDIDTTPDGRLFVVMELLVGQSLADLIKHEGALPIARATRIMRQTLRAVGAAHAKNIIHRDLKPDNIYLVGAADDDGDPQDFVKLLDFGISKVLEQSPEIDATRLTSTGAVMGTPLYMAPEQAMGEPTDSRADIYALGVILYEMVAGRPPFDGATYAALVMKVLTADADLLSEIRPETPAPIVAAVHRALEKDREHRFASCEHFAAALSSTAERSAVRPPRFTREQALDHTQASGSMPVVRPSKITREQQLDRTAPPLGSRAGARASGLEQTMASGSMSATAAPLSDSLGPAPRTRSRAPLAAGLVGLGLVGAIVAVVVMGKTKAPTAPPLEVAAQQPTTPLPAETSTAGSGPTDLVANPVPGVRDAGIAMVAIDASVTTTPPSNGGAGSAQPSPELASTKPAPPKPTPVTVKPSRPSTLKEVSNAMRSYDGKKCRALLAALVDPPPTDFRVRSAKAVCEMVAGNCEGGAELQRALYKQEGTPEAAVTVMTDLYCPPPSDDPALRLRRIGKQMSMRMQGENCKHYLAPLRAAGKVATSDGDRRTVGALLADIATCVSHQDRKCDEARTLLAEAQVFIPALALNELDGACR